MQTLEAFAHGDTDRPPPSVVFASGGLSWTRVRLPRLLSRIGLGIYAGASVFAVMSALAGEYYIGRLFGGIGVVAWPLLIVSYILSLTQSAFAASLEVSPAELTIVFANMQRKAIQRSKISGALVVEREMFGAFVPTVEIELNNGDVLTARLADPRSAQAIVKALGFGVGGKRVHASLAKPTRRLFHPLFGALAYGIALVAMFIVLAADPNNSSRFEIVEMAYQLFALLLYAGMRRLFRAPAVIVGDDGVLLTNNLRRRFLPRREIAAVGAMRGSPLVIELHGGEQVTVSGALLDDSRRSAVVRVIEERTGPTAASADRLTHYDRGGRALGAWREHLARAMQEASYRENAATVDEAALVLRSAHATPEQRVGAALALRIAGQPKERIRVAVEGAVDERVREALDAVAESDDDVVIEKALRRI